MTDVEQIKEQLYKHGYEYVQTIGSGSYSNVFLCKSLKYNNFFAVKCISHHKVKEYEYNALKNLHHPHIIQLYEFFDELDNQYLVMDYCPNDTLKQKGQLDYNQFLTYSRQVLEALSFCHSKLIAHRDIKPDNILLDRYNRVKLADFGFAKQFEDNSNSDERVGSIMYCCPELIKGQSSFNPFQADIYALGITFFYMVTGEHPFPSVPIEDLKRLITFGQIDFSQYDVDPEIQCLIMKMTSYNPKLRPTANSILNLPIFQQTEFSKSFAESKVKKINVYPVLSQKSFVCRPASTRYSDSFVSNHSIRKKHLNRKKYYTNKCDIVQPNVFKANYDF